MHFVLKTLPKTESRVEMCFCDNWTTSSSSPVERKVWHRLCYGLRSSVCDYKRCTRGIAGAFVPECCLVDVMCDVCEVGWEISKPRKEGREKENRNAKLLGRKRE